MRISELAERTGVPVPTLKYYLREGLLPAGQAQGRTRAAYADTHVERVRLIRALVEGAAMPIASVRAVVRAIENPPASRHELLGVAHGLIPHPHQGAEVTDEVRQLVADAGWSVSSTAPALPMLAGAIATARSAGLTLDLAVLLDYAAAADGVAAVDLREVVEQSPADAVRSVAVGTVLLDVVLAAMRRLAQESSSARGSG